MREDDSIRAEIRSAVLHITLNRPEKLNAFDDVMHSAIYDALAVAKFAKTFAGLGLVPDAGGTWWPSRISGEPRAKALAPTATPVSTERAADWGLIWRAVDDGDLMTEATTLADRLAAGSSVGLGPTKRLIQDASVADLDSHLDAERVAQRTAGFTGDDAEGETAFLAKRSPELEGIQ